MGICLGGGLPPFWLYQEVRRDGVFGLKCRSGERSDVKPTADGNPEGGEDHARSTKRGHLSWFITKGPAISTSSHGRLLFWKAELSLSLREVNAMTVSTLQSYARNAYWSQNWAHDSLVTDQTLTLKCSILPPVLSSQRGHSGANKSLFREILVFLPTVPVHPDCCRAAEMRR